MCEIDEAEIEFKFHDLCRLCASHDTEKIRLFSDEGKRRRLKDKIQCCLPFKVEESDAFPKSLCLACIDNLENTYEFRYKCIQVNLNLEKHLKKEKENQGKSKSSHSHRIHPEVSIFALPQTGQINNNQHANDGGSLHADLEDAPNPLDFLEVGVNAEDANPNTRMNDIKKQYVWNTDKRWLSVEHKPLNSEHQSPESKISQSFFSSDDNSNRRKNNNPRKIAREIDDQDGRTSVTSSGFTTSLPTPALVSISVAPASNSTPTYKSSMMIDGSSPVRADSPWCPNKDENQTYSCLLCERSFSLHSALNKHFSTTHGIEPYEMLNQTSLLSHPSFDGNGVAGDEEELAESLVEQETIIFCEVCRREFQDRASLWLHMVHAHREEASLSCGICLKIFSDSIILIEHVNTAHSGDNAVVQRRYSCQVCGRQHDSRQKLLKHATLHTLIDNQGQTIQPEEMVSLNNAFAPRDCPICHKKFFNQEKLDQHTKNFHNDSHEHTSTSPSVVYKCELCPSTHATRNDRWWHMYHSHSTDSRVVCELKMCRKIFVTATLKEEHCKMHHEAQGAYTNTCEVCGKLWESRTVFYKHMMNVHPKCLPTICGVCMKIFSNVPELRQHVKANHPGLQESENICCDVCGRSYAERSKMLRHRRVHNVTDGVPFTPNMIKRKDDLQCNICPDVTFDKLEEIAEHRRSVHQLFVCDLCPKFYNGNNHLWKHVSKQHKGDPNVTCNICLRTSASRAHLHRHKLKYHSDPIERLINKTPVDVDLQVHHKCQLCNREFRIRSLLNKHAKTCKGLRPAGQKVQPVNGMFPCSKCGKIFEQQGVLSKHMKNSHVMYYCEACPEDGPKVEFDKKTALLEHIRDKHANDPELFCDVEGCGKVLRVKADLQKHKLEHVRGYFTYICECCGDMFSNRKKLRKHLLTYHKSDVKHLCAVCVAILSSVTELAEHVQVSHPLLLHRPFTCQICGKCWSVSSKAVDHITKVHGTGFRPCKICWKVFTDEKELADHVQNHPPVEEKPLPTVKKDSSSSTSSSKSRPGNKYHLPKELSALGIEYENDTGVKRPADYDADVVEGGKRLRKKYKCLSCRDTFRSIIELKEHKVKKHDGQGDNVIECEEEESTSMPIAQEETEVEPKNERWTDVKPIACGICSKIWNSKKQLWQHLIRSHVSESMRTCGICLKVCSNYYDLFYHLDSHHLNALNDPAARFACRVCGHYHNSQSKLEKHIGMHKNPPLSCLYTCQYCKHVFRSVVFYREHVRGHESKSMATDKKGVIKKEQAEFSGFSINRILQTNEDNDHEDDIEEMEIQTMENEDDEDMVELDEEDSESENSDSKEDANVFRGYANNFGQVAQNSTPFREQGRRNEKFAFQNMPPYFKVKADEVDIDDADLESNISCSTVNSEDEEDANAGIVNGKLESNDEQRASPYGNVNNNQKQENMAKSEKKRNFYNLNGQNFFNRMTNDV